MAAESALRDYPIVGLALLAFGALTEAAAIALCVYGVLVQGVGLAVLGATLAVWAAGLWLMVLGGVREDWPARRKARE